MSTESPITASVLTKRLREEDSHINELVSLFVGDMFSRPFREMVPPAWLAQIMLEDLRSSIQSTDLQGWMEHRIRERLASVPNKQEAFDSGMPKAVHDSIIKLVSRPSTPNPALVRAIVDQKAVRNLFQTVLKRTLTDFGSKIGVTAPEQNEKKSAFGLRSKLMGVAKGVASVVGTELEKQLEERVNSFLQGAMGRVIDMVVERISDPKGAADGADFRADVVDSLMGLPRHHFRGQAQDVDPKQTAEDFYNLLLALSQWDGLEEKILEAIEEGLGEDLNKTLEEYLTNSNLTPIWRARLEEQCRRHAQLFFGSDAFEGWLEQLCATDS